MVLIAKQNLEFFTQLEPKIKVVEHLSTENTIIFKVRSGKQFQNLYNNVKAQGYNPFACMNWF